MPRAKSNCSIFDLLKLILNAIGVGSVLWWCVVSWRLHAVHTPESPQPVQVRTGKGRRKLNTTLLPVYLEGQELEEVREAEHPEPDRAFWVFCAKQWAECVCYGDIRWGNEETWHVVKGKVGETNKVSCNIDKLPDVLPGDDFKHCECLLTPGTEVYKRTNPMIIDQEEADELGATLVASCELFYEARKQQPVDMAQWLAIEGLCSEAWEEKVRFNRSLRPGPKQMNVEIRQKLFRARVDARFRKSLGKNQLGFTS